MVTDERIKLIGENSHQFPEQITDCTTVLAAYATTVDEMATNVEAKTEAATTIASELVAETAELTSEASDLVEEVGEAVAHLRASFENLASEFCENLSQFMTEAESFVADSEDLGAKLTDGVTGELGDAVEGAHVVINEISAQSTSHTSGLEQSAAAVKSTLETLTSAIEEKSTACSETVNGFCDDITDRISTANNNADTMKSDCEAQRDAFEEKVIEAICERLVGEINELLDRIEEATEREAKEFLDSASSKLGDMLEDFGRKITGSKDKANDERTEMDPLLEELDVLVQPLQAGIEAVGDLADRFF